MVDFCYLFADHPIKFRGFVIVKGQFVATHIFERGKGVFRHVQVSSDVVLSIAEEEGILDELLGL
jgi:hypothetical protein